MVAYLLTSQVLGRWEILTMEFQRKCIESMALEIPRTLVKSIIVVSRVEIESWIKQHKFSSYLAIYCSVAR